MFVISRSLVQVRQPAPVLKRTKRCVFLLDFFAFLIFVSGGEVMCGGLFLFYSGRAIPTQPNPTPSRQRELIAGIKVE